MTDPRPGNEPDPGDMAVDADPASEAPRPGAAGPAPAAEDEAAELGDFA